MVVSSPICKLLRYVPKSALESGPGALHYFTILSLSVFIGTPLLAQDVPMGCYVSDYSKEHLEQHPEQVVDRISILFGPNEGIIWADVKVLLADQGHAARDGYGGMRLSETAGNFNDHLEFGVECDGGSFDVATFDANAITIETSGFRISVDGCGGEGIDSTLLEADSLSTQYTLNRAELGACFW